MTEGLRFDCQQEYNVFLFSEAYSQAVGPIQQHIHRVLRIIYTEVNWLGRETHHSPPSNKVESTI
jgi:hypothetical protein